MADWEYSDSDCPKCGSQLACRRCDELGCEDGYIEDDDPELPSRDKCDACNGKGHQEWCRACGWDVTYGQFLSPQYEAEWLAKQQALNGRKDEGVKAKLIRRIMENEIGNIKKPENGDYLVACVVCQEKKAVMLYPHRLNGLVVGWVFVCTEDQEVIQGADVRIISDRWPRKPVHLGGSQPQA